LNALEVKLSGYTVEHDIDKRRKQISDNCAEKGRGPQRLYTLTVPTGGGKTLASLRFALNHAIEHNLDRIIYVIPYTSIIDQNARVVRDILTDAGLNAEDWILEHHSNLEPTKDEWRHKLVTDNWDRPIIFTTLVQFLESIYGSGTRALRRFHPMARSVLIFDEVQNVPIKCTHLFCNALNFLNDFCSTTSVLCTATQPALDSLPKPQKGQLKLQTNAEIIDTVDEQFLALKRVDIVDKTNPAMSHFELAEFCTQQFEQEGSCLVIVNTKKVAIETYKACQNHVNAESLFYLTTNLCAAHREKTLSTIRKRLDNKQPTLIVSTALIECGVDLSVAAVVRSLSGLDSIAQAAGRCNRHAEREQYGKVYVVKCDEENLRGLPDIQLGQQATLDVFSNYPADEWLHPETLKFYFKRRFHKPKTADEMAYPIKLGSFSTSLFDLLSDKANPVCSYNNDRPAPNYIPLLDQSFHTAARHFNVIDQATQAVIVPFGEGEDLIADLNSAAVEFDAGLYYETLRKAQRFSVNLYNDFFDELFKKSALVNIGDSDNADGLFALKPEHYDINLGVSETPNAGKAVLNV
jgi:CRISPR-associated endonuclease/helicase Cas3